MFSLRNKKGNWSKTDSYLKKNSDLRRINEILHRAGNRGVDALAAYTPKDTGLASESWYYEITNTPYGASINWYNTNVEGGCNVAILIQYGHGTRNGGYVAPRDFINPAMASIFKSIAEDIWREVT